MTDRPPTPTGETQVKALTSEELEQVSAAGFLGGVFVAAGDFNTDGRVDAADYVVWRKSSGI